MGPLDGMITMKRTALLVSLCLVTSAAFAAEIVGWRTDGTGRYPDAKPVAQWSGSNNVVWKTPMPKWSNSTPVLVGDRLYVCSEPETLLCVDLKTGRILWQQDCKLTGARPRTHQATGYSAMTPVSDGKHVWAVFGTESVVCYDLDGKRKWIKKADTSKHQWGTSASPLLVDGKLIVQINDMVAYNAATGDEVWRRRGLRHSWGTGIVTRIGNANVILTAGGDAVNPSDGSIVARGISKLAYCTPLRVEDKLYYVEGGGKCLKLASGGGGFSTQSLWNFSIKGDRYYASPIHHEGLIYAVTRAGAMSVVDASNGSRLYEQQLRGMGCPYPSIAYAAGHIFVSGDSGATVVIKAGRTYQEVARNNLGEMFRSSPVFRGNRMYIRGYKNLFCIGDPSKPFVSAMKPKARPKPAVVARPKPKPRTRPAAAPLNDERKARGLLSVADNYLRAGMDALAKKKLNQVIDKYPDSEAAKTAKAKLAKLDADDDE